MQHASRVRQQRVATACFVDSLHAVELPLHANERLHRIGGERFVDVGDEAETMQCLRHVHLAGELNGTLGCSCGVGSGFVDACFLESRERVAHGGAEQDEAVGGRYAAGGAARCALVSYTVHVTVVADVVAVVWLDVFER